MASIYKRKNENGTVVWRAVIRIKGYPTVCDHFERKQEAEDWSKEVERQIKLGQYKFDQHKKLYTFHALVDRYIQDGAIEHHRSADDTRRHLTYWQSRLDDYALVHITSDLLGKERQILSDSQTARDKKRTPSTINRYMASISSLLSYAAKNLNWINENPALRLIKLKENPSRDRVLSENEITRLLAASRSSKSPYLYCVILLALTTGARQGEILNLEWKQIDFQNKIACIKETKNGRPRSIALCDSVIIELQRLYEQHNPLKSLVFASKTVFGRIDIKKAWQQALKRAGIANCRAHDMRHTFCTYAAAKGASNLQLQTATGHRTLSMLLQYTHMDVEVTKKFSNQISEQILKGN
ncbi:MAG TPA: tyrosine-type recombinase/integrase [Rhabdochlamydiaceae bacterium]|nr:tyrosine-type recombinase/integrase [Rhabdochlamydiaceae bacterium]HSX37825.1 tyrosine-type recombinase/integrase [Chlamydiales bacterium]